jgi:CheY-like chemotaxis protein
LIRQRFRIIQTVHNRAILTSLRAAAIVVIATGLNEVIAGAEPRYEPVYVYLVAVAAVTWLDGVLLGALAAVFSAAFYAMLFMPRETSWTMSRLTPAGALLLVVLAVGVVRYLARRNRKRPPRSSEIFTAAAQPLLASPVEDHTEEVLAAIDELRTELRAGLGEVQAAAAAAATPRAPEVVVDTARITELERLLERARLDAQYAREESASLATRISELENAVQELARARSHIRELESSLALSERAINDGEKLRADLAVERDHSAKLTARIEELESALVDAARVSDERDSLAGRVTELELAAHEAERVKLDAASMQDRLENEVRAERARTIAARAEMGALTDRIRELEVARERIEAELRSESMRTEAARAETEALQAELDRERAEFNTRLNTIVAHLASDHESDLGQAMAEREEARAEARMLKIKVQEVEEKLRAAAVPQAAKKPRVLVAHPDTDVRSAAKASLDRAGYDVITAADGLEALRMAVSEQPHVVIADAIMPKMNGRELCQLLKSQDKTAHIRVILLLRSIDEEPKGELAPDEVLRKPVPPETLRGTLASLLV